MCAFVLVTTLSACTPSVIVASPWMLLGGGIAAFAAKLSEANRGERIATVTRYMATGLRQLARWFTNMSWRERAKVLLLSLIAPVVGAAIYVLAIVLFLLVELPIMWPTILLISAWRKAGAKADRLERRLAGMGPVPMNLIRGVGWLYGPLSVSMQHGYGSIDDARNEVEGAVSEVLRARAAVLTRSRGN